jgi:predicted site-specific integrase-resolvase
MAKIVNGDVYLSPLEASGMLRVSYKTLQRWAETGEMSIWVGHQGARKKKRKKVKIDYMQTPTGYRYYRQDSIERLSKQVSASVI